MERGNSLITILIFSAIFLAVVVFALNSKPKTAVLPNQEVAKSSPTASTQPISTPIPLPSPSDYLATPQPTNYSNPSWKTFSNNEFWFQYPNEYKVVDNPSPSHFYLDTPIVSIENNISNYSTSNYSQHSIFTISQSNNTASCYQNPTNHSPLSSPTYINNQLFYATEIKKETSNDEIYSIIYRIITQKGKCFEIAETIEGVGDKSNIDQEKAGQSSVDLLNSLHQILFTFRSK